LAVCDGEEGFCLFDAVFDASGRGVVFRRGREGFPAHGVFAGKAAFLVKNVEVFADALTDAGRVNRSVVVHIADGAVAQLRKDTAVAAARQGDGNDVASVAEMFADEGLLFGVAQDFPAFGGGQGSNVGHGVSSLFGQL